MSFCVQAHFLSMYILNCIHPSTIHTAISWRSALFWAELYQTTALSIFQHFEIIIAPTWPMSSAWTQTRALPHFAKDPLHPCSYQYQWAECPSLYCRCALPECIWEHVCYDNLFTIRPASHLVTNASKPRVPKCTSGMYIQPWHVAAMAEEQMSSPLPPWWPPSHTNILIYKLQSTADNPRESKEELILLCLWLSKRLLSW